MKPSSKITRRSFCIDAAATVPAVAIPSIAAQERAGLKPLIKYRGGKSKELSQYLRFIPKKYETYYEPFVGGGATFVTLLDIPQFSYKEILRETQRIDVVWFNRKGLAFPQMIFEVIDSVGTLNGAFNRSLQLRNFRTKFFIVAPDKHREKYNQTIELEIYQENKERFTFITYDEIVELYENTARTKKLEANIFGMG